MKKLNVLFWAAMLCTSSTAFAQSSLQASATSTLSDENNNSLANPGEQIRYSIAVSNKSAQDADAVALTSNTDPNATLVSTKIVSSGAFDDCYATSVDGVISPPAATGLSSNDLTGLTIVPGTVTSKLGIVVTINSDGSFSYVPSAGFSGTDSFVYSAVGADGEVNQGIATLAVLAASACPQLNDLLTVTGTTDPATAVGALQADLTVIGSSLSGAVSTANTASLKTNLDTLRTAIDNKTTASASAGVSALAGLVSSAPSGVLKTDIASVIGSVDGTTTGPLSDKVATVSNLVIASGSKTNLVSDVTALNTIVGGSGTLTSRLGALRSSVSSSPTNLTADLTTALGDLGGTGSLAERSNTLKTTLGGSDATTQVNAALTLVGGSGTLASRLSGTSGKILASPTGNIATDLGSAQSLVVTSPGSTLQADIQTVNSLLNGTGTGSTIQARIGAPTVNATASNLATLIGGTGTLAARLGDPGANFASISSMIGGSATTVATKLGNSGTATLAAQIASSAVSVQSAITTVSGKLLTPSSVITTPSGTLAGDIDSLQALIASSPSATVEADLSAMYSAITGNTNHTSALLTTITNAKNAVRSDSTNLNTAITSTITAIGGPQTSAYLRIIALDNQILATPTGVARSDFATLRGLLVATQDVTAEADVQFLNTLLNGTGSGSTTQDRIGSPTVNASSSSLASILGGSGNIADRIGDPIVGTTGLAALIRNGSSNVGVVNGFDASAYDTATSVNNQIAQFLAVLNQASSGSGAFSSTTEIRIPVGTYNSMSDVLRALNHD